MLVDSDSFLSPKRYLLSLEKSLNMLLSPIHNLIAALSTIPFSHASLTGLTPCDALISAGLSDRILTPLSPSYSTQLLTWYNTATRRHPWCIVLPHTSLEVSLVLTTLSAVGSGAGDWAIAVKSGGHGNDASNNVDSGVTIDLQYLDSVDYYEHNGSASIGPGARWGDVYKRLGEQGGAVTGGRDANVGVGGFLLGGGMSYYTGRTGFGCDNVINFEVVLASGDIINANATSNDDLWRALKGGSSNFGVVTRFDLEAFPARNLTYGQKTMSTEYEEEFVQAVFEFVERSEEHVNDALVPYYSYDAASEEIVMRAITVNTKAEPNTRAFDKVDIIPAIEPGLRTEMSLAEAAGGTLEGVVRGISFTLTFKNDLSILRRATELHHEYVIQMSELIGASNFTTLNFFQPLPSYFGAIEHRKVGNMLGLDHVNQNNILWVLGIGVLGGEDQQAIAHAKGANITAMVHDFAESVGGGNDLIYLNYADASQDPIGSYGLENIQLIRDAAAKYDPAGFFQQRIPGGFKISRVSSCAGTPCNH
ncbi:FAD binding domain-containing protein [Pseudovirgaria hyperparasitica]|uniref:FAD binding domain-containing protein n=1 Tax=Pseudovirgaria hyperparasitica TaxID=470096 RepID=A0A6A6WKC5_9PEZI|nr:FAD binding domain-containing protein [Pseudovirgaria hyperparasitica]KAF2762606.1 FAD binding domain-containing protein [Pseudovirgaria hyperparasitica]